METGGFGLKKVAAYCFGYLVLLLISFALFIGLAAAQRCQSPLIFLAYIALLPLAVALFSLYKRISWLGILRNILLASAAQLALILAFFAFVPLDLGCAVDARVLQSQILWSQEARPFAIDIYTVYANGKGVFYIKNKGELGTLTLTSFSVGNGRNETPLTFAKGEERVISVEGIVGEKQSVGGNYDLPVNITYKTPDGKIEKQYGARSLVGKYT